MGLGEAVIPPRDTAASLIGGRSRAHLKKNTRDRDHARVVGGGPRLPLGINDRVEAGWTSSSDSWHALCVRGAVAAESTGEQILELPSA